MLNSNSAAFTTMVAAIGLIVFDITPFVTAKGQATLHGMTFSKLIMQSLEYAFYPAMVSLFFTGGVFGFIRPHKWLTNGLSLIIFLPVNAFIDLATSPTSHNLLPLELLMYIAFFGASAVAGAFLGSRIRTGETVWDQPKK